MKDWLILAAVAYFVHTLARHNIRAPYAWPTIPTLIVRVLLFVARWTSLLAHGADDGLKAWREHRRPIQPANERRKRENLKLVRKTGNL